MSRFSLSLLLCAAIVYAQRGTGDWMTGAFDAQRSNWVRNDGKISPQSMASPGFAFLWKMPLSKSGLTPPALLDFYISYRGFRSLAFIGAASNKVVTVDIDLARLEWEKTFPGKFPGPTATCPGGMTSTVARPTIIVYPPVPTGRGPGRGNPAKSGVGEPFEGAVTLKGRAPAPPPPPPPTAAANARRATAPPNVFAPRAQYIHAISADGMFHSMYVSNGDEPNPAVPFLPANANAQGLIIFDGNAYVSTSNKCGGADDGVWALNLESKQVSHWKANAGVVGTAGPAVGADGALYAAAGSELTVLEETTLKPKATYSLGSAQFTSSPLVFEHKGKELVAATASDGTLVVLDKMAVPMAKSAVFSATNYSAGALASWQDPAGTRWILAPAAGNIAAFKLVEQDGKYSLQRAWVSKELISPVAPIVVNGVVFALSSGKPATPAVLYALDALTGKEVWNSGSTIASYVRSGALSAGGSRVYVSTVDGVQYAFGFPIEH